MKNSSEFIVWLFYLLFSWSYICFFCFFCCILIHISAFVSPQIFSIFPRATAHFWAIFFSYYSFIRYLGARNIKLSVRESYCVWSMQRCPISLMKHIVEFLPNADAAICSKLFIFIICIRNNTDVVLKLYNIYFLVFMDPVFETWIPNVFQNCIQHGILLLEFFIMCLEIRMGIWLKVFHNSHLLYSLSFSLNLKTFHIWN